MLYVYYTDKPLIWILVGFMSIKCKHLGQNDHNAVSIGRRFDNTWLQTVIVLYLQSQALLNVEQALLNVIGSDALN